MIKNSSGPSQTACRSPAEVNLLLAGGNTQPVMDFIILPVDLSVRMLSFPRCANSQITKPGLPPFGLGSIVAACPCKTLRLGKLVNFCDVLAIDAVPLWIKKHSINHFSLYYVAIK